MSWLWPRACVRRHARPPPQTPTPTHAPACASKCLHAAHGRWPGAGASCFVPPGAMPPAARPSCVASLLQAGAGCGGAGRVAGLSAGPGAARQLPVHPHPPAGQARHWLHSEAGAVSGAGLAPLGCTLRRMAACSSKVHGAGAWLGSKGVSTGKRAGRLCRPASTGRQRGRGAPSAVSPPCLPAGPPAAGTWRAARWAPWASCWSASPRACSPPSPAGCPRRKMSTRSSPWLCA